MWYHLHNPSKMGQRQGEVFSIRISMMGLKGNIASIESDTVLIKDASSAMDLAVSIQYERDCSALMLPKSAFCEDFFNLRTRIAGEILQKFVNYGIKMAIVGDFSCYDSKALRDFIYESNRGTHFFFVASTDEAVDRLQNAIG